MRRPWVIALLLAAATLSGCLGQGADRDRRFREGRRVFVSAGCGGCHTVASAHTHGQAGPDFDTSEPLSRAQIRRQLNRGEGGMPSFRGRLTRRQEEAVTEFVFQTMHRRR
ncbi:MAG TPA: cytochrome c [Thermoleophilaceae bacterium]|jgi:mono/diheme cytochrome c family protein|nr:cytochrome c [Thermoleophilaceae bacterium]